MKNPIKVYQMKAPTLPPRVRVVLFFSASVVHLFILIFVMKVEDGYVRAMLIFLLGYFGSIIILPLFDRDNEQVKETKVEE